MRLVLAAALALLVFLPAASACSMSYSDPTGDANPPLGPYDLTGFEAVAGPDRLWWRVQAASLEATTTSVQYLGQIDTGEREGEGDGAAVLYHPICPIDLATTLEMMIDDGQPRCHLSRSHDLGDGAVSFEFVAILEAGLEAGGWLNVTIPYDLLGVEPGRTLNDLRSTAQMAVVTPSGMEEQPNTITPVITDQAGSGQDSFLLCGAEGAVRTDATPTEQDDGGKEAPGVGVALMLAALAIAGLVRRLR